MILSVNACSGGSSMKKLEVGWEKFKETKFCRWLKEYWGLDDWIGLGIAIMGMLYYLIKDIPGNYPGWFTFYGDIHAELIGIGITVLILGNADQALRIRQEKQRLILQMGSPDNALAIEAVRQLESKGWLYDGTIKRAYLKEANLERVDLEGADLEGVNLAGANLKGANLDGADLEGANLECANLEVAIMDWAYMEGVNLAMAHIKGAYLRWTDMRNITYDDHTVWTGTKYNKHTHWPEGFDPDFEGCLLI
jgi:hypothetical protein